MKVMFLKISAESNYDPPHIEAEKRWIAEQAKPDIEWTFEFPETPGFDFYASKKNSGGPTAYDLTFLAPGIVRKVIEAEKKGFDAVIVFGNYDPGVEAARHAVRIPVIGPGRVGCHFACMLADKIGVVTHSDKVIPATEKLLASYGVGDKVVGYRAVSIPLTELHRHPDVLQEQFVSAGKELKGCGAQIIYPACSGHVPLFFSAASASKAIGIPVLDVLALSVETARIFVRRKISHSPAAYPPIGG